MKQQKYIQICDYIHSIIKDTEWNNHVYAVGGCVRDYVMGREPKDIDLVVDTENGGIKFAEWLKDNNYVNGKIVTYPTYGTAMFKFKCFPDEEIECVQTRKEQYKNKDSRNPETEYGSIVEDAMRRDLTINALYYNFNNILDPTGKGLDDIKNGVIQVTSDPHTVYSDDPLRMLRTIRFASRYGWKIDTKTELGIICHRDRLSIISKERIADEINKMLMDTYACRAMISVKNLCGFQHIAKLLIPGITIKDKDRLFSIFDNSLIALDALSRQYNIKNEEKLILSMCVLFAKIGKTINESNDYANDSAAMAEKSLRNLKYSNDFIKNVVTVIKNQDILRTTEVVEIRRAQYKLGKITFNRIVTLNKCFGDIIQKELEVPQNIIDDDYLDFIDMFKYKLPVNGEDIMKEFKIEQGKQVKEYLDGILEIALKHPHYTKDELINMLKFKIKNND